MIDIVSSLKSGKIRVIEIKQSEDNYKYVERCFKDIARIPSFHFKKEFLTNHRRYFGCVIKKKPFYLLVDISKNIIRVYDVKAEETAIIPKEDYETIKKTLFSSKSATSYIKRNEHIKTGHKITWYFLLLMCLLLFFAYLIKKIGDGQFTAVALNIFVILALQDCINVYLLRFERKHYDKYLISLILLEIIYVGLTLSTLYFSGAYDAFGRYNNMLSILLTFGTILIKFDKPYKNE